MGVKGLTVISENMGNIHLSNPFLLLFVVRQIGLGQIDEELGNFQ